MNDREKRGVKSPPNISRENRRLRGDRPRARTIAPRRLTKAEIQQDAELTPYMDFPRPKTRRDCLTAVAAARLNGRDDGLGDGMNCVRPCPFAGCRHHLTLDINPESGSIKVNFPNLEVWEIKETCSLDVADRGGATLEDVGEILNLTRERVRQVEVRGLLKLKRGGPALTGEPAISKVVGRADDEPARVRGDDGESEEECAAREKRRPTHYRAAGESAYFGNPHFIKKAVALPAGEHRDIAIAVGQGELTRTELIARLHTNFAGMNEFLQAIDERRYRPPRTDLPLRPSSRFATPEFAAKVLKIGWRHPFAKKIGRLAAAGMHADMIARLKKRPVAAVLAVLHAIRDDKPIPDIGARSDEISARGHEPDSFDALAPEDADDDVASGIGSASWRRRGGCPVRTWGE